MTTQDTQDETMADATVELNNEREIRMIREYDAPRALVWKALTDPAHVEVWWGPDGFTNTTKSIDVRPGGSWVFVMHGPNGIDYDNVISYREVVEPERLVFRHGATEVENADEDFGTVITLEDLGGKTRLTMTSVFKDQATRDFLIRTVGAIEGGKQTLQKLDDHLERMAVDSSLGHGESRSGEAVAEARVIRVSRVFDAPRDLVWKAWTNPDQVSQWWGPDGFSVEIHEMDLRPGGFWRLTMQGPDGAKYPNKSVFREVVKPERIVYALAGGREGGPGTHFVSTWTFTDLGDNRTELTFVHVFDTAAERDKVVREFNAIEGGNQTMARLAQHLRTVLSQHKA